MPILLSSDLACRHEMSPHTFESTYVCDRRLVDAKEPQKMVVFFRYLFDERYLTGALRDDWLKLYDKQVGNHVQKISV